MSINCDHQWRHQGPERIYIDLAHKIAHRKKHQQHYLHQPTCIGQPFLFISSSCLSTLRVISAAGQGNCPPPLFTRKSSWPNFSSVLDTRFLDKLSLVPAQDSPHVLLLPDVALHARHLPQSPHLGSCCRHLVLVPEREDGNIQQEEN